MATETTTTPDMNRRTFMKTVGVTAGAAAVGVSGVTTDRVSAGFFDNTADTVGASFASPGLAVVSATQDAINWVTGDGELKSGVTELQKQNYWGTKRYYNSTTRELSLSSDLIEYIPDSVFADAKIAAIEAMNNGLTESEVETAALDEARPQIAQLEKNVIEAGNQGMRTIDNYVQVAIESGFGVQDVLDLPHSNRFVETYHGTSVRDTTLVDGTTYDNVGLNYVYNFNDADSPTDRNSFPVGITGSSGQGVYGYGYDITVSPDPVPNLCPMVKGPNGDLFPPIPSLVYNHADASGSTPDKYRADITGERTIGGMRRKVIDLWENDLKLNIQNWVSNAYSSYASGDVEPSDLLTATEIATTITEEEPDKRALAHLRASGIGVDPENPATIETQVEGGTLTAEKVVLGSTGTTASVSVGQTVDPSTEDYEYTVGYSTQNIALQWPHYATTLDGGIITVNQMPAEETLSWFGTPMEMVVQTSKGETASFDPYQHGDPEAPNTSFDVDLSGQLDEPIADVSKVTIFSAKSESVTATKIVDQQFTVTDGAVDTYDFSHDRNIQTTDNYVTAEEWDQRNQELKDTIEELRDQQDSGGTFGGSGGGGSWFNGAFGDLFGGARQLAMLVGGGIVALITLDTITS